MEAIEIHKEVIALLEERFLEKYGVSRWAYIDDLLPKQFGNSEQLKGGEK